MATRVSPTPMGQQSPGITNRPIRRRTAVDGRVRSGCLTCKARKKKCDGQTSGHDGRCGSCVRLGLVCEQAPLRRIPRPPRGTEVCGDEEITSPRSSRSEDENETASRTNGRQTDAQTDTRGNNNDDEPARKEEAPFVSRGTGPCIPVASSPWAGTERVMLRYFLDHVAPLCSILQQDGGSFCSVLLPMAIVDPSLLHALFAYASVHFDAATPAIPGTPEARLKFENQVTRGVAEAIAKNDITETTVACALVISTADVVGGDTSRWPVHLQGAGHLINHLESSNLLRTADGAFLLRYFAYHDIMASMTTGRRTLVDGMYWAYRGADIIVDSADSFMGLAHHVFRHLADICVFVADTADLGQFLPSSSSPSSSYSAQRSRDILRGEDMATALRSQDLHLQVDPSDDFTAALIHHAEAFRFAGLFYIYRHLLRFCDEGAGAVYRLRMEDCVQNILQHVSQVPSPLFCEMGLLFPLFMAGIGSSGNAEATRYIHDRLVCVEAWTKFKHVGRARELLLLLWGAGRTDWEVMLRELNWNLSLA